MNNTEYKYRITAYVDNELNDEVSRAEILEKINSSRYFKQEYLIQKRVKEALARLKFHSAPQNLKEEIIRKIKLL